MSLSNEKYLPMWMCDAKRQIDNKILTIKKIWEKRQQMYIYLIYLLFICFEKCGTVVLWSVFLISLLTIYTPILNCSKESWLFWSRLFLSQEEPILFHNNEYLLKPQPRKYRLPQACHISHGHMISMDMRWTCEHVWEVSLL